MLVQFSNTLHAAGSIIWHMHFNNEVLFYDVLCGSKFGFIKKRPQFTSAYQNSLMDRGKYMQGDIY